VLALKGDVVQPLLMCDYTPGRQTLSRRFYSQNSGIARKYVASTTLEEPPAWSNSALLKDDVPGAVAELKEGRVTTSWCWGVAWARQVAGDWKSVVVSPRMKRS
jgi:hypothetical protein